METQRKLSNCSLNWISSCCETRAPDPPSGKGVYFRSESLRWYKITFPKAFLAPERDMICILLWYLAVKPAPTNEFVLLITNCSGERHEGWGGVVPQQKQCTEQLLFLIITIKADKQAANADFSELRAQKQTASVDHTSHRGPCWDEGDYSATASQPVRILCACKILLLVCYTNTPCSRCLWKTGVINSEMITDIYILHERTASYLHFSESHEQN